MGDGNHLIQIDHIACHLFSLFDDCEYEQNTTDTYRHHPFFVSCTQLRNFSRSSRALPLILGIGFHAWQCDRNETSSCRNGILPANSSPNPSLCRPGHQERPSPKEMDLPKKLTEKTIPKNLDTPVILNMSLAGKSTMKVDR